MQQPQSQLAGATVTGGSPAWKPATHTTRILVVEDEQDIAGLIKHALERDGDTIVDMVSSGAEPHEVPASRMVLLIVNAAKRTPSWCDAATAIRNLPR